MEKNVEIKKAKPKEILELERMYNVTLIEEKNFDVESEFITVNAYFLNSDGQINGLSTDANIVDVASINILNNLELIYLSESSIEDISPLIHQKKLKFLFLRGSKIKDISPIGEFENLIELGLSNVSVKDFSPLGKLYDLQTLYSVGSRIKDITFIKELRNLKRLRLGNNQISDISVLANHTKLEQLSLHDNLITDISILENLESLKEVDLRNNFIKVVPKKLAKRLNWLRPIDGYNTFHERDTIIFEDNPLEYPPSSVIELGEETVKNYYEASEKYGRAPLSEGRIIVIGDGSAGKSSLIERVLYNTFDKNKAQTNGIKIEHLNLLHPEDKRDLIFHIWDFGGQEIQHAVHKFFFTEGCLYVLVLDNRKEEEPEYWLQQIESLGGKAPVLVVFNKQDQNSTEIADRKFLKEKYPNIVEFYNTSCESGFGIDDFKKELQSKVIKLRTVEEQFPNNWLAIKKAIEERTTGDQHYLTYETYQEICKQNSAETKATQKLLLKYFNTIGAVTWFGEDTYLKFLHVLNPAWITQGVYKILTAKKTANLFGQINIGDFKELLQPTNFEEYTYDEKHYGYILSMMKKFDLCESPDDIHLYIPSAFGKTPKVEYSEFKGENVLTYILQFKDYMPLALIHRYTTKKLSQALDNNYWYTGIVIQDTKSDSVAMVHADKEAKRIYVRIKGVSQLGMWESIRREIAGITSNYAQIPYDELVAVDDNVENNVNYADLVSHIEAKKQYYFHPKLRRDFNVGYLMGMFESKEQTIDKYKKGKLVTRNFEFVQHKKIPPFLINILNNNSPTINTQINTQINVDIDIQIVNNISSVVKGDADYLLSELKVKESNKELGDALKKIIQFADDSKSAKNSGDVIEKGWGRKLKSVIQTLANAGEQFKNIEDGGEALKSMFHGLKELAQQFNLKDVADLIASNLNS